MQYQIIIRHLKESKGLEIHTAEPLVPDLSSFWVEIAIAKLKKYQSAGNVQIPVELTQAEGEILRSEIHRRINSIWNNEELSDHWN